MTEPTPINDPPALPALDRNLAMFGYLCLFLTVFFAGVPAFIAAILAYARKGDADPIGRSHYRFQIRSFWWCFWLTTLSVSAGIAALAQGVWRLVRPGRGPTELKPVLVSLQPADPTVGSAADTLARLSASPWILLAIAAALFALAVVWTWAASIWGARKLALGKPIGRV